MMKRIIASVLSVLLLLMMVACAPSGKDSKFGIKRPVSEQKDERVQDEAEQKTKSDTAKEEQPEQSASAEPQGVLAGTVIVVDPGHGLNSDTGMEPIAPGSSETKRKFVSGAAGKNQTEEELNLAVCLKLKTALEAMGAKVFMTREGHETTLSNVGRAEFGNEHHADLSVKIHADGSANSSTRGVSVLIPGDTYIKDAVMLAESRRAADLILEEFVKSTDAENRGVIVRNDMTGFNWSTIPVVLVEMGFLSNPEEDAKMETEAYRDRMTRGIANGVAAYFAEK